MEQIYNLLISNIYLYICIIIGLVILTAILLILTANERKRKKIKSDFVEAEKVEAELEKKEDTPVTNELENILQQMQQEIDVKPEDVVKKFEEEQEEKAIISYQELVDNVKAGKIEVVDDDTSDVNFVESLISDDTYEPVQAIEEYQEESSVTPQMVRDAVDSISSSSVKEEPKKFKTSDFISPVFGRVDNNVEYPTVKRKETLLDIMNTRDYNELTEEIKRQEEFLNALKEFRNNL